MTEMFYLGIQTIFGSRSDLFGNPIRMSNPGFKLHARAGRANFESVLAANYSRKGHEPAFYTSMCKKGFVEAC